MERRVLAVRTDHPAWDGRKIRRVLLNAGHQDVPAAGTIAAILHRTGLIDKTESSKDEAWMPFEHERPSDRWQMEFIRLSASTVIERKSLQNKEL